MEVRAMRIKRYLSLLLAALLLAALTGCGAKGDKKTEGDMTIRPAQLSQEEEALAQLLALGMESYRIFDFRADSAKSVQFNTYELENGEWKLLQGGGGTEVAGGKGRIALTFGKIPEGVRLALQAEGANVSTFFQPEPGDDVSAMAFGTSKLDEAADIELEKEIPLILQIATSKDELIMYKVDYFGMPRELEKHGYEHIYAITVTFSAQPLGGGEPSGAPAGEPSPSPAE